MPGTSNSINQTTNGLVVFGETQINIGGSASTQIATASGSLQLGNTTYATQIMGDLQLVGSADVETNLIVAGTVTLGNFSYGVLVANSYGLISAPTGTSGQVLTSNGASASPTFQAPSGGLLPWTVVTGSTQAMVSNNAYISNDGTLVTYTLPSSSNVGDVITVVGESNGLWKIAQNSGNVIRFGSESTTSGATGYLASTLEYDCVQLVCISANAAWLVYGSVGNLTVT
jgi:hypothetical protein